MKHQIILTIGFIFIMLLLSVNYTNAAHNDTLYGIVETAKNTSDDSSAKVATIRAALVGRWDNPFFTLESQNIHNGSLRYHFRDNGTYTKTLGGAETQIQEEGTWEVSEDGKHLLMRSKSLCNGQEVAVTQVATIKYLQLDELVLEQSICVDGVAVSAESKDFYFNKY